jgi:hypothetical protein
MVNKYLPLLTHAGWAVPLGRLYAIHSQFKSDPNNSYQLSIQLLPLGPFIDEYIQE